MAQDTTWGTFTDSTWGGVTKRDSSWGGRVDTGWGRLAGGRGGSAADTGWN
jgi:hypothetical protein